MGGRYDVVYDFLTGFFLAVGCCYGLFTPFFVRDDDVVISGVSSKENMVDTVGDGRVLVERGLTYNVYSNGSNYIYEGFVEPVNYFDGRSWNPIVRAIKNNQVTTGLYTVSFNPDSTAKYLVELKYNGFFLRLKPVSMMKDNDVISVTRPVTGKAVDHIFPTESKYHLNDTFIYNGIFGDGFDLSYCYYNSSLKMTLFMQKPSLTASVKNVSVVFNYTTNDRDHAVFHFAEPLIQEKFSWNADATYHQSKFLCTQKLTDSKCIISIPASIFSSAKLSYPLELDPTIIVNVTNGADDAYTWFSSTKNYVRTFGGLTTRGATTLGNLAGYYYGWNSTPGETGNATSISAWVKKQSLGTMSAKCCLYYQSNGTLVATTNEVTGIGPLTPVAPKVFTFSSPVKIYNVKYFISIVCNASYTLYGSNNNNNYDDALYVGSYATAFVNPITWDYLGANDFKGSIYCTYKSDSTFVYNNRTYFDNDNISYEASTPFSPYKPYYIGYRFRNVTVDKRYFVSDAGLRLSTWQLTPGTSSVKIKWWGADVDNCSVWDASTWNMRNVSKTTAIKYYNSTADNTPNGVSAYLNFNMTTMFNEIKNRSDWNTRDSCGFIFSENNGSATASLTFYTYESVYAKPRLTIIYSLYPFRAFNTSINGSFYNTSRFRAINTTVNGSFYNTVSYHVVNSSINGSFYNSVPIFRVINNTINGSFYNLSRFKIINSSINGSFFNSSVYHVIDNTINGSFYNSTPVFRIINSTINGSFYNATPVFHIVNDTINGSFYNVAIFNVVNSSINGSFYNNSVFRVVDDAINGSFYNVTPVFHVVDDVINGSFYSAPGFIVIDDSVNGSFYNHSVFRLVDDTINGSFYNMSYYRPVDDTMNGLFYNMTRFIIVDNTINGSFYNLSTGNVSIILVYPLNASSGMPLSVTLSVTISHSKGYNMTILWWDTNGSLLGTTLNASNGTYTMPYANASAYNTIYWWRVNVSDVYGSYVNQSQWYRTLTQGLSSNVIMILLTSIGIGRWYPYLLLGSSLLLFLVMRRRKKKKTDV